MLSKFSLERTFVYVFSAMMLLGMHYFQHNQGGTGLALPFNLVVWCFASILIGLGLIKVSQSQTLRYNKTLIGLAICAVGLWIPLFYPNAELGAFALDRLIGLAAGLLLIFSLLQLNLSNKQWQQMLYMLVAAVLIESLYALTQMYLLTEGNWVGFNVNSTRAPGIFQQPNVLGTFVLFGPLASAWLLSQRAVNNKWQQTLILLTSFAATWVCFLTGSRTTLIALFLILPLMAPYLFKTANSLQLRWWLFSILLGVLAPIIPELFASNVTRDALGGATTAYRVTMLEVSWQLFKEQPLLGWGYGAYDGVYHAAQATLNQQGIVDGYHFNVAHPHNELAYWAVEGGLVTVLALFSMSFLVIKCLIKHGWQKALFHFALLFPCLLHSMTELPFYHSAILWILFCTFLARMIKSDEVVAKAFPAKFAPKLFGILIPCFTLVFMLTGLQAIHKIVQFERSGSANANLLEEVINPIPLQTRYEFNAMSFRLNAAVSLDLKSELENYLVWSEKILKRQARTEHFYNRSVALRALGFTEQALANDQLANSIYPNTERVSYKLISATNGGEESLKKYLVWNRTEIESKSNPQLYIHQINALVRLGDIKPAVDTLIEAQNNFPEQVNLNSVPSLKPYIKIKDNT
ncbi:PglL family O-oligosaccharyltransferase [Agarivorans sp. Alg241-V36]|uniref:PglL family O-oligosaccharyltransferase n=1 Tax=Agarivorans sp. Alg241-V36 TaxID=2305992 RepID=UPI0013D5C0FB|nr:Wzy polymerase domain-containing protein [Agarivorans sp. Alg241-V36]